MKVYLDDIRREPIGWHRVKTADECIEVLKTGRVEELSLDHDLAEEHYNEFVFEAVDDDVDKYAEFRKGFRHKTGYDVVLWMVEHGVWPGLIILHTMNPAGRLDMKRTIERHAPEAVRLEIRVGWRG